MENIVPFTDDWEGIVMHHNAAGSGHGRLRGTLYRSSDACQPSRRFDLLGSEGMNSASASYAWAPTAWTRHNYVANAP
jgi:hypothetical protein